MGVTGIPINRDFINSSPDIFARPNDWRKISQLVSEGQQKVAMLCAIYDQPSNIVSFRVSGSFVVDWGDGSTETFVSGTLAAARLGHIDSLANPETFKADVASIVADIGTLLNRATEARLATLDVAGALANTSNADAFKAVGFAVPSDVQVDGGFSVDDRTALATARDAAESAAELTAEAMALQGQLTGDPLTADASTGRIETASGKGIDVTETEEGDRKTYTRRDV